MIVAIMVGGKSRRMGRDKAAIELDGMSLLDRVASAASDAGHPVLVVGRNTSNRPVPVPSQWETIADDKPDQGPLGGLATALRYACGSSVLLCATDTPAIEPQAFRWLAAQAAAYGSSEYDGVVATWEGKPEPLFAVYFSSVLPMVNRRMTCKQLSMQGLIEAGNFKLIELPKVHAGAVADVDSPGDLSNIMFLRQQAVVKTPTYD